MKRQRNEKKDKSEDVDVNEVTWLIKGLDKWGLEFGWRIKMLTWVTRQLYRLRLIDMNDVKAVVGGSSE